MKERVLRIPENLRILAYGGPGTGKTTFALGLRGLQIEDYDGHAPLLLARLYRDAKARGDAQEVERLRSTRLVSLPSDVPEEEGFNLACELHREAVERCRAGEYSALACDGATRLTGWAVAKFRKANGHDPEKFEWSQVHSWMQRYVVSLCNAAPVVVLICHESLERDQGGNIIGGGPLLAGWESDRFPALFTEMWRFTASTLGKVVQPRLVPTPQSFFNKKGEMLGQFPARTILGLGTIKDPNFERDVRPVWEELHALRAEMQEGSEQPERKEVPQ